jgi:hypothetical protein
MADSEAEGTQAPAALIAPSTAPARSSRFDAIVDTWFIETMNGTIVSRNTDILNHVAAAVQDLKQRLAKEN